MSTSGGGGKGKMGVKECQREMPSDSLGIFVRFYSPEKKTMTVLQSDLQLDNIRLFVNGNRNGLKDIFSRSSYLKHDSRPFIQY